jgi:nitronate monooxygenase
VIASIIQAPMAGVQGVALAAAVCNAGGLGSLPAAMLTPDRLRDELRELRALTSQPFNVNFFCHAPPVVDADRERAWRDRLAPYFAELDIEMPAASGAARAPFDDAFADVLAESWPAVVSFHFGLPSPALVERVKRGGALVLSSATTVDEARWLEARGVDAIIAQGTEAGGHRGSFLSDDLSLQLGTFALVPQIARATKLPVIAAGGIADARGVRAAKLLGATSAQVGTAYMMCPEATTSVLHRAALASETPTAITNVFTGRPARGIVNRLMRELGAMTDAPAFPLAAPLVGALRAVAEKRGSSDFSPLWAGQNRAGCKPIAAADLTRELGA